MMGIRPSLIKIKVNYYYRFNLIESIICPGSSYKKRSVKKHV